MFGILDIIILVLIRRHRCTRCERVFWAPPPHASGELAVGRERYICACGNRYETGRHEWAHLNAEAKGKYLWSGLVMIPVITVALGAIGGYFLRWHEPYWFMSVFIGFLGLLSGLICSAVLLFIRWLPVAASLLRTRHGDQTLDNAISYKG
jgi:hypothetical protein